MRASAHQRACLLRDTSAPACCATPARLPAQQFSRIDAERCHVFAGTTIHVCWSYGPGTPSDHNIFVGVYRTAREATTEAKEATTGAKEATTEAKETTTEAKETTDATDNMAKRYEFKDIKVNSRFGVTKFSAGAIKKWQNGSYVFCLVKDDGIAYWLAYATQTIDIQDGIVMGFGGATPRPIRPYRPNGTYVKPMIGPHFQASILPGEKRPRTDCILDDELSGVLTTNVDSEKQVYKENGGQKQRKLTRDTQFGAQASYWH